MSEKTVSQRTLDETPERALALLRGLGTCPAAHALLVAVGFDPVAFKQGWDFLLATANYDRIRAPLTSNDPIVTSALRDIDDWDEQACQRIGAALQRHHPAQAEFVFQDLQPARGAASVMVVTKLLKRLDDLEAGRSDETRQADQEAMATLAKRGITQAERTRMAGLLKVAQSAKAAAMIETSPETEARQQQALLNLHSWYTDWATTAKAVIRRRDYLIRLGLAKRRSRKTEETETTEDSATETT